ncbi:MAG: DnaB-like helicase C-terminal domain-containing protein [Ruminococcus sp.]|nr:DnaB-like helicase C-terminal domain-containing protein [Ruminococcus sp.]
MIKFESEQYIIGAIVLYPEKFAAKISSLSDDLFANEHHKELFQIIRKTNSKHPHFDTTLVLSEITDIDLKTAFIDCINAVVTSTLFEEHLNILKENAKQRFISAAIDDMRTEGEYSATKLINVCTLANQAYSNDCEHYGANIYNSYINSINKPKDAIYTPISAINRTSGGIRKGTLFIIGARPSTGKTALALNIASYNAIKGKKVLMFSLEMTNSMIIERLLSDECNISYARFINQLTSDEERTIRDYFNNRGKALMQNLKIIDDVYNIESICSYIENERPDLVLVDFIQIVQSLNKTESKRALIDYISSEFKRIAKRTNCSIIVLSQLTRAGKDMPTMSDLKESGGLEQDGDCIALLHRPYVLNKEGNNPNEAQLIIDKNKFGRTGIINLHFDGEHQRFTEQCNTNRRNI